MPITWPVSADTPLKKLAFCRRVWRRLHIWHRERWEALGGKQMTPAQRAAYHVWRRTKWRAILNRVADVEGPLRRAIHAAMSLTEDQRAALRASQATAEIWDPDIDLDEVTADN